MFTNTKSDLGPCNLVHDAQLQAGCVPDSQNAVYGSLALTDASAGLSLACHRYQMSDQRWRLGYEVEFVRYVTEIINNTDRKYGQRMRCD